MPATLPDHTNAATVHTYPADSAQRVLHFPGVGVLLAGVDVHMPAPGLQIAYGPTRTRVIRAGAVSPMHVDNMEQPVSDDTDVLAQVVAAAGSAVAWRPDTPEELADRWETTEAFQPAAMESIARRDAQ